MYPVSGQPRLRFRGSVAEFLEQPFSPRSADREGPTVGPSKIGPSRSLPLGRAGAQPLAAMRARKNCKKAVIVAGNSVALE